MQYHKQLTTLQVTWDEHSLFVRGERIFLYSGEFHPWRLPSVDLWTDVLQKIKAIGYNGVSFYVDWAPLEGRPGHFSAEGVFAYEPFFAAAEEVGLYLIARPGPYSEYALVRVYFYLGVFSWPRY
jgi:beta-galactosidase GanA